MTMPSTHLRVALGPREPFVFQYNSSNDRPSYTGMLIELFEKILAYNNMSFTYEYYLLNSGGGSYANGSWTGIMAELVYGRADIALFPLTRTATRLEVIDCTYSYLDEGLTLLVQATVEAPGPLSVLAPFEMTLWVTLLCTIIAVALLFWALDLYGKWIRAKQIKVLQASGLLPIAKLPMRGKKGKDKRSHVMTSFMAAAGAPERPERISWGGQVLYIVYCFFCLVVLSAYTANLTSFLAVQRANAGISGLQDVIRSAGSIVVSSKSSTYDYFMNSQDSLALQLRPSLTARDTVAACVQAVRSGAATAFVSDKPILDYQAMQQPCDLAVVGDPFGPGNLVIGLKKDSPLTPLFNAAIQAFSEDGTLTELQRSWFEDRSQCGNVNGQLTNSRLSVVQMLGAFVFLVMGVTVAFVTGTIENLKWCLLGWRGCCGTVLEEASVRAGSAAAIGRLNIETSQHGAPLPEARVGLFSRLSLALLGVHRHSGNGADSAAGTPRSSRHCGSGSCVPKDNVPSGGSAAVAVAAGSQLYGVGGGGQAVAPTKSVGTVADINGNPHVASGRVAAAAAAAAVAVALSTAMMSSTGRGDSGGADIVPADIEATAGGAVCTPSKSVGASAASAGGPSGPEGGRPPAMSPSYDASCNTRPSPDQGRGQGAAAGQQTGGGGAPAAVWGLGEQVAAAAAGTISRSLPVVWDTPEAAAAAAAAAAAQGSPLAERVPLAQLRLGSSNGVGGDGGGGGGGSSGLTQEGSSTAGSARKRMADVPPPLLPLAAAGPSHRSSEGVETAAPSTSLPPPPIETRGGGDGDVASGGGDVAAEAPEQPRQGSGRMGPGSLLERTASSVRFRAKRTDSDARPAAQAAAAMAAAAAAAAAAQAQAQAQAAGPMEPSPSEPLLRHHAVS